jgi:hypothetical protein
MLREATIKMTKEEEEKLAEKVAEFIRRQNGFFTLDDVLKSPDVAEKSGATEEEIHDMVLFLDLVFPMGTSSYISRASYFHNAQFLVIPRNEEVIQGILIPGHRFVPFFSPEQYPWHCHLINEDQEELPCIGIERSSESLTIYYNLLGVENIPEYLIADQQSNKDIFTAGENAQALPLQISAFDFSAQYRKWNFKAGEALLFTVRDWWTGTFSVAPMREEKVQDERKWVLYLEKGFKKTFNTEGLNPEIPEQITLAYFYAGKEVLNKPPLHFGGFLSKTTKVFIVPLGMQSRLWHKKKVDAEDVMFDKEEPQEDFSAFAELKLDVECPCTMIELEAFMRDELFRAKGKYTGDTGGDLAILKRILTHELERFSQEHVETLRAFVRKRWQPIAETYNFFSDQTSGKLRSEMLALIEDYYAFLWDMQRITIKLETIPIQTITGLSQITGSLISFLDTLNNFDGKDTVALSELQAGMPRVAERFNAYLDSAREEFADKSPKPRLRLVKPNEPLDFDDFEDEDEDEDDKSLEESKHLYVLRVSLRDIRPQIWRSIRVPGNFSLGQLNDVIQGAMGWHNSHLHSFTIDEIEYGPIQLMGGEFSEFDVDEEDIMLDELDLREKHRFLYVYDFGDYWEHQILVSKILPVEDFSVLEKYNAYCLGGKRACPPEDCGGPDGYGEIINALKSPQKKKHHELLVWNNAEAFDPEFFNVDLANKRMALFASMLGNNDDDDDDDDSAE